ncbi:hypothetical protein N9L68_08275 [bacterium]|nr:hypothetical protein [bacterium]
MLSQVSTQYVANNLVRLGEALDIPADILGELLADEVLGERFANEASASAPERNHGGRRRPLVAEEASSWRHEHQLL